MTVRAMLTALAAVSAAGLLGLLIVEVAPIRAICAVAFCLLLPGSGWARRLHRNDRLDQLATTVVVSICATVTVTTGMLVTGLWSIAGASTVLGVITVAGFVPYGRAGEFARHLADRSPDPRLIARRQARRQITAAQSDKIEDDEAWLRQRPSAGSSLPRRGGRGRTYSTPIPARPHSSRPNTSKRSSR
jgi:hypothetical protein